MEMGEIRVRSRSDSLAAAKPTVINVLILVRGFSLVGSRTPLTESTEMFYLESTYSQQSHEIGNRIA